MDHAGAGEGATEGLSGGGLLRQQLAQDGLDALQFGVLGQGVIDLLLGQFQALPHGHYVLRQPLAIGRELLNRRVQLSWTGLCRWDR